MTQLDASLSILVHGASKTGKSTLTSTAPLPICVLDAEGGWRFISEAGFQSGKPLRRIPWDPNKTVQPPRYDGTWDVDYAAPGPREFTRRARPSWVPDRPAAVRDDGCLR